ncbi:MAG: hypothetical protein AAGD13_00575 [Pseudomonadota bacterium]
MAGLTPAEVSEILGTFKGSKAFMTRDCVVAVSAVYRAAGMYPKVGPVLDLRRATRLARAVRSDLVQATRLHLGDVGWCEIDPAAAQFLDCGVCEHADQQTLAIASGRGRWLAPGPAGVLSLGSAAAAWRPSGGCDGN